jgi:hypothetical protein
VAHKMWMGSKPVNCQICHKPLEGSFIDGKLRGGPWAIMCVACNKSKGEGLGTSKGQQYSFPDLVLIAGLLLLALFLPTTTHAQTRTQSIDKAAELQMYDQYPWPYELDGNPDTREWLNMRSDAQDNVEYQVVVLRGTICRGAWFNPWDSVEVKEFMLGGIMRVGRVDIWVAQGPRFYQEVSFNLPTCR